MLGQSKWIIYGPDNIPGIKAPTLCEPPGTTEPLTPGRPPARWRRTFDPNYSSIELLTFSRTQSSNPGAEIFSGRHQSKHPEIDEERALFGGQRRGFEVVFTSPIEWETQEKRGKCTGEVVSMLLKRQKHWDCYADHIKNRERTA